MKFKQVTINTTHSFADLASMCLIEAGSEGVTVIDNFEMQEILKQTYWDYVDDSLLNADSPVVLVSGFFDENFDAALIENELNELKSQTEFETGSLEVESKIIDSEDWENVWKKYYKPIKIKNISIVPNWLKNPHKNTVPVFINPGMAFGTGKHETTEMCISLMQTLDLCGKTVADVGCGSGILGICAIKLGSLNCAFIDTDPNAVTAAKENCSFNGVSEKSEVIEGSLFEKSTKSYDVILANLTADILIKLFDSISSHIEKNGKIVISGIIETRRAEVQELYSTRFKVQNTVKNGEWCALVLSAN